MKRLVLTFVWICSTSARADETTSFYRGVRPLGMGGVGVATVNDETAPLVNPSALSRLRDTFVTVVDPEVDANFDAFRINRGSPTKMGDVGAARGELQKLGDHHYHQRAQIFPSIVTPGFGVGVFAKQVIDAELQTSPATYIYDYTQDVAGVVSAGGRAFGGILKFGGTARLDSRRELKRRDLAPEGAVPSLNDAAVEGTALGADAALSVALPVEWLPTFAAVYRDVGRTSFGFARGLTHPTASRPAPVRDTLDLGFAVSPIHSRLYRSTWSVQVDDAGGPGTFVRHAHAGVELNYADAVFLRAGVNQRYWTLGLECSFVRYQVQLASYGEEIGTDDQPREDRRGVTKISILF